jgi:hypothetical protein
MTTSVSVALMVAALSAPWRGNVALGSDHDDTPQLKSLGRHDARITDFYAYRSNDRFVMVLCTNPTIPPEVTSYRFPSDLVLRFNIDNHSPVVYRDETTYLQFGGEVKRPERIAPDVLFEVRFDAAGRPVLQTQGLPRWARHQVRVFAGLRDDPFIRTPRAGRNVAAVVIDMPLFAALSWRPTLLAWGSSEVAGVTGPIADHAGRPLRSQFTPNMSMNDMTPSDHMMVMGMVPDVLIYNLLFDLFFDETYPNGRALADDIVMMVPDIPVNGGVLPGEPDNRATTNDVPFLPSFPYLAAPPPPPTAP